MVIYYPGKDLYVQTTVIGLIDFLCSLHSHHGMAGQLLTMPLLNNNNSNSTSNLNSCTLQQSIGNDVGDVLSTKSTTLATVAVKKQGVSGESCDATGQSSRDILIRKFEKDFR